MKLFLSPHNDDETLFGAYTLMHEKPLVVICTDSVRQFKRGEKDITAKLRWEETQRAMKILGCDVMRLGIPDDELNGRDLMKELEKFGNVEKVFAPAMQGGNNDHDIVSFAARALFGDKVIQYTTYSREALHTTGKTEVSPKNHTEKIKKISALTCYQSQIHYPPTAPHFDAVKGKSEWYI